MNVMIRVAVKAAVNMAHRINAAKCKHIEARLYYTIIDDGDLIADNLERDIYGITAAQQHRFNSIFSIPMAKFETVWEYHGTHELQRPLEHPIVYFGYP
jgi:hypothetical protein